MDNEVNEPAPKYKYISPEEYLEMERDSPTKHQYFQGEVFAMAGTSPRHNIIFKNLFGELYISLKGKPCQPFGGDFRIHIPDNGLYTYPDISIVCKPVQTTNDDNLTNPIVIIEILSKSTRDYDRGTKFNLYRHINTLQEYILIDSMQISAEIFSRTIENKWQLDEFTNLSDKFTIQSLRLTLEMGPIYHDVIF